MRYRVLGPFRIEGRATPAQRIVTLLGYLLLHANEPLGKRSLIELLFGSGTLDRQAQYEQKEEQLRRWVSEVRKVMRRAGAGDVATVVGYGYRLQIGDDELDALRFERLVDEAAANRGRLPGVVEAAGLEDALGLWSGARPLEGLDASEFERDGTRLVQRRIETAIRLADLRTAADDHAAAARALAGIAATHPADDGVCERLVVAYVRSGRTSQALTTYAAHAYAVAEELDAAPARELAALADAIRRGDDGPVDEIVRRTVRHVRDTTASERPTDLGGVDVPRQLRSAVALTGRDDVVRKVREVLVGADDDAGAGDHAVDLAADSGVDPPVDRAAEHVTDHTGVPAVVPVVVLAGRGGAGKTAVAATAAHGVADRFPGGQIWLELHDATGEPVDPADLLATAIRSFGVRDVPASRADRRGRYRTLLADRSVLVVLDDAADEDQVADLVPGNPRCGVIVTARRQLLGLDGAHHPQGLDLLDDALAVELFSAVAAKAGATLPDTAAEAAVIARVVRLCDGLPLALQIAGALRGQSRRRTTADLADRLEREGARGFTYRKLSVDRTIAAGYERLGPHARLLFRRLGLLRFTSFPSWVVSALLAGTGADPDAVLAELDDLCLLEPAEDVQPRWRLHDLTRDYAVRLARGEIAADQADVTDEPEAVALAGAYRALLTLARRAHDALHTPPSEVVHGPEPDWPAPGALLHEIVADAPAWFRRERSSILAAVGHCADLGLSTIAWDLAVSSHEYYTMQVLLDDWYETHTRARDACRAAGDLPGEAVVTVFLAQPALSAGRPGLALPGPAELEVAVDLLAGAGDRWALAIATRTLANLLRRRGHLARPLALFEDAYGHYAACGDPVGVCQTRRFVGHTYLDLGRYDEALQRMHSATLVAERLDDGRILGQAWYWTGQVLLARGADGDLDAAATEFGRLYEATGGGLAHAYALQGRGTVAIRQGRYEDARADLDRAAALAVGDVQLLGRIQLSGAELSRVTGAPHREAYETAAATFAGVGAVFLEVAALGALAVAYAEAGEASTAGAALWDRIERLYDDNAVPQGDRLWSRPVIPEAAAD